MGWFKNLFNRREQEQKLLTEGIENGEKTEEKQSAKISFSIYSSLSEYEDWYKTIHTKKELYKGPIIVDFRNNEYPIILNFKNANRENDKLLLGVAKFETKDGEKSDKWKEMRMEVDRLLSAQHNSSNIYDLKGFLQEGLELLEDKYNVEFTAEGERILLNDTKKFISMDRTVKVDNDTLEYERIVKEQPNALLIPDSENSYAGTITLVVPMEKYDLENLTAREKKSTVLNIISQLTNLYKTAEQVGIFEGKDVRSVHMYRELLDQLQKTSHKENLSNIEGLADLIKGMPDIRKCAIEFVMESSLYYEDVIEEFINEPDKYAVDGTIEQKGKTQEQIELLIAAMKKGKEEFYNRMKVQHKEGKNEIVKNTTRSSFVETLKVNAEQESTEFTVEKTDNMQDELELNSKTQSDNDDEYDDK